MKKVQNLIMAASTGLFLMACGGAQEENTDSDTTANEESNTPSVTTTYTIDPAASNLEWKGSMLGMYDHTGTVDITEGSITVTDGKITSGDLEIDLTSIVPTDDNYKEDNPKEKLVTHLSSADFFNVEVYPTAAASITSTEGETGTIELTIRGNTNSEEMSLIKFQETDGKFNGKGELTFDRTKYDVSFVHPIQDMVISNNIEISVQLVGTAQ